MDKKFALGAIFSFFSILSDFSTASHYDYCARRKTSSPYRFSVTYSPPVPIIKNSAPIYVKVPSSQTQAVEVIPLIFSSTHASSAHPIDHSKKYETVVVNLDQAAGSLINYSFLQLYSQNLQSKASQEELEKYNFLVENVIIIHSDLAVQSDIKKDIKDLKEIISITMRAALYVQRAFETLEWKEGTYERVRYNFITAERGFRWLNKEKADFVINDTFIDQQIGALRKVVPQIPRSLSWKEEEIICLKNSLKYLPEALGPQLFVTVPFPQGGEISHPKISTQKVANEIIERWKKIPLLKEALFKVTYLAGEPTPAKKGEGLVWKDKINYLKISRGYALASYPPQQVDHVIVRRHGRVIGTKGQMIEKTVKAPNPKQAPEASIPLSEWLAWNSWFNPGLSTQQLIKEEELKRTSYPLSLMKSWSVNHVQSLPCLPERSLTSCIKNIIEWGEEGIDVTTNACKWDYQLISKPIPLTLAAALELAFEIDLKEGGFAVGFLSQDQKRFLAYKIYRKLGLTKDTLKLPFGTTDKSVYLIFSNNVAEPGVSHFIIRHYGLAQMPLPPEKVLTPFSPQKVEYTAQGIDITTNACKWDYQLISKAISMVLATAPEVSFEVDLKEGGFAVGFLSQDQKRFLAYKIYRKLGLTKDTLKLPFGTTDKSIYLIFSNNVVEPGVSRFVIKDYVVTQAPLLSEKMLTPFSPQKVELTDQGIAVITNSCKWDYQLMSKPIPITLAAALEVNFEINLEEGGFAVKFLSQDQKKFLASKYYQKPGLVKDTLILPLGISDKNVYLVFTNNLPEPGVSHFIIKDYTLKQILSFPKHSMPPVPLVTPLPTEEKKASVETFPQAEPSKASILATPIHPQQQKEQEGFKKYDGPEEFVLLNERGIWEVKRYDKVAEHTSFGKFYRDPNTNRWWSKDKAGHGGSAWKVFKETATGLKWEMDTDKYGDEMEEKHKSETGTFIPWQELNIKK